MFRSIRGYSDRLLASGIESEGEPGFGDYYNRNCGATSSAIADATVNQVVRQQMVKEQQMQWTGHLLGQGPHPFLQTRMRVLNDELEGLFRQRYPGFRPPASDEVSAAA